MNRNIIKLQPEGIVGMNFLYCAITHTYVRNDIHKGTETQTITEGKL